MAAIWASRLEVSWSSCSSAASISADPRSCSICCFKSFKSCFCLSWSWRTFILDKGTFFVHETRENTRIQQSKNVLSTGRWISYCRTSLASFSFSSCFFFMTSIHSVTSSGSSTGESEQNQSEAIHSQNLAMCRASTYQWLRDKFRCTHMCHVARFGQQRRPAFWRHLNGSHCLSRELQERGLLSFVIL